MKKELHLFNWYNYYEKHLIILKHCLIMFIKRRHLLGLSKIKNNNDLDTSIHNSLFNIVAIFFINNNLINYFGVRVIVPKSVFCFAATTTSLITLSL